MRETRDNVFVPDEELQVETTIYHIDGTTITNDSNEKASSICAKKFYYPSLGVTRYYVKRYGAQFYDPTAISQVYKYRYQWSFGPITEYAFRLYLEFLGYGIEGNKHKQYLKLRAERLV